MNSLDKLFKRYERNLIKNIEETQRYYAHKLAGEVISSAPSKTGSYVSSIKVGDTVNDSVRIETEVSSDMMVGKYVLGRLLEEGTSPHIIEAVNKSVLRWEDDLGVHFAKRVHHPGTKPMPHWQPAIDHVYPEYLRELRKVAIRSWFK